MQGVSNVWTPTRELLERLLERAIGSSSVTTMGNASVGLMRAPLSPSVNTVLADITEANFDGYVRKAAGFNGSAHIGPGNLTIVQGSTLVFVPDDTTTVNTIYGQFLVDGSASVLLGVEMFDQEYPLPTPAYQLTIVERFGLTPGTTYGASLVAT
jgi:hypothetical protein